MVDDYAHLWGPPLNDEDALKKKYPDDIIVLDFKASDSLIESVGMSSTLDPYVGKAMRDAAEDFTGTRDALISFLQYKDIAVDLQGFFESDENFKNIASDDEGNKAIVWDEATDELKLNTALLLNEDGTGAKDVVTTAIGQFLQVNPRQLSALRALKQASRKDADTYATQLMANYMRRTTITIHGTTNIGPFHKVIVKGVMPNLEGMYRINAVRESITPQGFQTILDGSLIGKSHKNARVEGVPVEAEQEPAFQEKPPASDVDQASGDE
jgi:hypothetical protein